MKTKCKFLVVDDNETDQIITGLLLEKKLGIDEVHQAYNGPEALAWLMMNKNQLGNGLVILLDIKMPEMDGFEFLDTFERMEEDIKEKTQIFMLSSSLDPFDIERAERHKYVKKMLNKPLPAHLLGELISQTCS